MRVTDQLPINSSISWKMRSTRKTEWVLCATDHRKQSSKTKNQWSSLGETSTIQLRLSRPESKSKRQGRRKCHFKCLKDARDMLCLGKLCLLWARLVLEKLLYWMRFPIELHLHADPRSKVKSWLMTNYRWTKSHSASTQLMWCKTTFCSGTSR